VKRGQVLHKAGPVIHFSMALLITNIFHMKAEILLCFCEERAGSCFTRLGLSFTSEWLCSFQIYFTGKLGFSYAAVKRGQLLHKAGPVIQF
jgi:hypothetical protein